MESKQTKLIEMLKIWLKKNELDGDTIFYTIDEWKERKEPYHNDSEFVIITEGGLHFILNYGDPDEFDELVNSFGYYYELGHSWNLGFYLIDEDQSPKQISTNYSDKLRDIRWQKKRKTILEKAEYKCEDCTSTEKLEIHHCYYRYGYEPWEYPLDALRCLCNSCHAKRGTTEFVLRGHLASLKTEELEAIINLITTGLYWYPREEVFTLLNALKYDQVEMKETFARLLTKRSASNW